MKIRLTFCLLALAGWSSANTWTRNTLDRRISPETPEELKSVSSLDGVWKVSELRKSGVRPTLRQAEADGCWKKDCDLSGWKSVEVPHASWHRYFPQTYPDHKKPGAMYNFNGAKSTYVQGWFGRDFTVPSSLRGARIFLRFGSVAWESHLWINGVKAGSHRGSFTGFRVDVTDLIEYDRPNRLALWVYNDFGESPPRHVYGKMFFVGANAGGITGGVTLEALPPVSVAQCLITPELKAQEVGLAATLLNHTGAAAAYEASVVLLGGQYPRFDQRREYPLGTLTLKPGENRAELRFRPEQPVLWEPDRPYLYRLFLLLREQKSGAVACSYEDRFGYREFVARGDQFFLNGKRVRLFCGNIFTSGDWNRFAPDNQAGRESLRRQKREGANTVRYHMAGSDSHRLLAMADEEGLLVISEFPMFHRVFHELAFPDPASRREFMTNVRHEWRQRLFRDYNHPSCVIWSLSNEVWADSTVDELNELYRELKPLDRQHRPMSADSGIHSFGIPTIPVDTDIWDAHLYNLVSKIPYPFARSDFDRYFADLKKIYGRLDRPAAAFECLHLGFGKPSQIIPADRRLSVDEYLRLAAKNRCEDVNYQGLRAFLAWERKGAAILDLISKRALEQFRLETRLQGFHPWWNRRDRIFPAYRNITAPVFAGIELLARNQFAGRDFAFTATLVKDDLAADRLTLKTEVVPAAGGHPVAALETAVILPPDRDKTEVPVRLALPGSLPTGFYQLVLTVVRGDRTVSVNRYRFNLLNPADLPPVKIPSSARLLVYEPGSPVLARLLTRNGVEFRPAGDLTELDRYSHLILHPDSPAAWKKVLDHGGKIREWVGKGGRLLLLEVPFAARLDWIMRGYAVEQDAKDFETTSLLLEPVLREHPLFAGLTTAHFDTLNGARGVVGNALIYPLGRNLIGAGFPPSRRQGIGGLVYEAGLGKGDVLISQVRALERYDADATATRYLHNLLNYFGGTAVAPGVLPLEVNRDTGMNHAILAVTGADCEPVDLKAVVNRGFRDETAGDGKGGWTDAGVSDFRQAPVGRRQFLNLPFEIIDPAANGGKSVLILNGGKCPSFPREASVRIGKRYRRLFFLHTAWYLSRDRQLLEYKVRYRDGSETVKPVRGGTDIGDWFAPSDLPGAPAVWSGRHPVIDSRFGFYLMMWELPHPEREIDRLEIRSMGISVPVILAVTGEKYVEYAASTLGRPWSCNRADEFGKSFGIDRMKVADGVCRFRMTRPHSWLALNQRDAVIDASRWKRLTFRLRARGLTEVKVIYFSPTGDNGVSERLKPTSTVDGWNRYDLFLDRIDWRHGSSPEAKQWGGRQHTVSSFAIDLYAGGSGTEVELGPVALFKD